MSRDPRACLAALVVLAVVAVTTSACKQAEIPEEEHYQPSSISSVKDGEHPVVTLTDLGARRIGLETAAVVEKKAPKPEPDPLVLLAAPTEPEKPVKSLTTLPYAAVLYDAADGQPYVFVNTEKLSFVREDITIESIDTDTVEVSKGPAPGTRVVTRGGAQVHGAELEYGAY